MTRFGRAMLFFALMWFAWVGAALYVAPRRALPDAQPPITLASCNIVPPGPPLTHTPRDNYDMRNGRRVGSIA